MTDEASFHEGYRKALEDVSAMVDRLAADARDKLGEFVHELCRKEEQARCTSRSSLASGAAGPEGY